MLGPFRRLQRTKHGINRIGYGCFIGYLRSQSSYPRRISEFPFSTFRELLATTTRHTNLDSQNRNAGDPEVTNQCRGPSAIPRTPHLVSHPGTSTFRFSNSECVWRVGAVVKGYREKTENRTILQRLGVDTKNLLLPAQIPNDKATSNSNSPVLRAVSREPCTRGCHSDPYTSRNTPSTAHHGMQRPSIGRSSTTARPSSTCSSRKHAVLQRSPPSPKVSFTELLRDTGQLEGVA